MMYAPGLTFHKLSPAADALFLRAGECRARAARALDSMHAHMAAAQQAAHALEEEADGLEALARALPIDLSPAANATLEGLL